MKPVTFTCEETLPLAPEDIAGRILDVARWPDFAGCWPIPGITAAEFEARTPGVVGSRIRVINTDGSSHIEEIVEWQPDRRLQLRMEQFSPPLSRLATEFLESWAFRRLGGATRVTRSFELHPKSPVARPVLWLISLLLKRAIARHLREMSALGQSKTSNHSA
jgi:Polyketide cyclase / dehydrase and lipid transport